jgi:hypothetical protein
MTRGASGGGRQVSGAATHDASVVSHTPFSHSSHVSWPSGHIRLPGHEHPPPPSRSKQGMGATDDNFCPDASEACPWSLQPRSVTSSEITNRWTTGDPVTPSRCQGQVIAAAGRVEWVRGQPAQVRLFEESRSEGACAGVHPLLGGLIVPCGGLRRRQPFLCSSAETRWVLSHVTCIFHHHR